MIRFKGIWESALLDSLSPVPLRIPRPSKMSPKGLAWADLSAVDAAYRSHGIVETTKA